jgi:internalin A
VRNNYENRGPVKDLEDLELLPNLRVLCIASQQIEDISPLACLSGLYQVELRFNQVSDVSALSGLDELNMVGLNSNPVKDISPLAACESLKSLDLCGAEEYEGKALALFGDFDFLDISNGTDSWLYLDEKQVAELKISFSGITDLACIDGVEGFSVWKSAVARFLICQVFRFILS